MSEKCINVEHNGKIHRLLDIAISIGYIIGVYLKYMGERVWLIQMCSVLSGTTPCMIDKFVKTKYV